MVKMTGTLWSSTWVPGTDLPRMKGRVCKGPAVRGVSSPSLKPKGFGGGFTDTPWINMYFCSFYFFIYRYFSDVSIIVFFICVWDCSLPGSRNRSEVLIFGLCPATLLNWVTAFRNFLGTLLGLLYIQNYVLCEQIVLLLPFLVKQHSFRFLTLLLWRRLALQGEQDLGRTALFFPHIC